MAGISGQNGVTVAQTVRLVLEKGQGHVTILLPKLVVRIVQETILKLKSARTTAEVTTIIYLRYY